MLTKIEIKLGSDTYKGKGETVLDALNEINLEWNQIVHKPIIIVTRGKNKAEKVFSIPRMRRMFLNKVSKMQQAKFFELLLSEATPVDTATKSG